MPPSAIIGFVADLLHHLTELNCHPPVPKPVLIFVIQTLPGPIPTLVASAPQYSKSLTAFGVPTFPAIIKTLFFIYFLICSIIFFTFKE